MRLLAVPSAGMGAGLYHGWGDELPSWVEVWAVASPGREHRLSEPPAARIADHVGAIAEAIETWSSLPFVVFGHSMGAMVAFELARQLRDTAGPLPLHLMLSALPPAQVIASRSEHQLEPAALLDAVRRRYGGMPAEVEAFPDVLEWALEILRADLRALETHRVFDAAPLPVPITALGGDQDPSVNVGDLRLWARETEKAFAIQLFPGDHRYVQTSRQELLSFLRDAFRRSR
jgi:medium-chain acyl-[acyl-carrier-protein] hydrolase